MSKTEIITLRITAEEKALWEDLAECGQVKLSEWIRTACNLVATPPGVVPGKSLLSNSELDAIIESKATPGPSFECHADGNREERRQMIRNQASRPEITEEKLAKHAKRTDSLKPPCSRCVRFGYTDDKRNLNCPDCGGKA